MPEICRFYGIVIKMYFADHAHAHFFLVRGRNTDDTMDLVVVVKFGPGALLILVTVYAD